MLFWFVFSLQTSSLVASEILKHQSPSTRATVVEKWAAVAEVCRDLHNFNSVLEIISAFMSSSIYRLKKTWEKVSKQVYLTWKSNHPSYCLTVIVTSFFRWLVYLKFNQIYFAKTTNLLGFLVRALSCKCDKQSPSPLGTSRRVIFI